MNLHLLLPLLILVGSLIALIVICFAISKSRPFSRKRKGGFGPVSALFSYLATLIQLIVVVISLLVFIGYQPLETEEQIPTETQVVETTAETVPPTTETLRISVQAEKTASSDPENWDIHWEIIVADEIAESYTREETIRFSDGNDYFALPGVSTFRGNNYRNNPVYGTADISYGTMTKIWNHHIGSFNGIEWIGCAWTGQPLVVQWDDDTKAIMNLYDSKKEKADLVEVIYATLDGYIHFYDLEDGSQTRDPIFMAMNFKGAGSLDPRGYPILYVGSGLYVDKEAPRMYAISLIDGTILYEYGNKDEFAPRNWPAFDSSPLVDAETDTLIWPGESGLLYTIKLNTDYDMSAGTLSMDPDDPVRTRYSNAYSEDGRYVGYESSAVVVDSYLYAGDNGGMFYCVDLNTMELVWAQDVKDDINSTPLFIWGEDGKGYLYTASSLDYTAEASTGTISIYKLDASTGEIVWEYPIECVTIDGVSGGVQSTPLQGKEGSDIEGMIFYSVARTPTAWDGKLIAFDMETGEVVWETATGNYGWSSPIAFYTEEGKSYIFTGNASGVCRLIDGATGEVLDILDLDETIEATPVAFGNTMVLGTREGVYGIKIS